MSTRLTKHLPPVALRASVALCAILLFLPGCERVENSAAKGPTEGPAETAGKQLDKAAVEASRGLKRAAEETGKAIENAGIKLQEKAQASQAAEK